MIEKETIGKRRNEETKRRKEKRRRKKGKKEERLIVSPSNEGWHQCQTRMSRVTFCDGFLAIRGFEARHEQHCAFHRTDRHRCYTERHELLTNRSVAFGVRRVERNIQ